MSRNEQQGFNLQKSTRSNYATLSVSRFACKPRSWLEHATTTATQSFEPIHKKTYTQDRPYRVTCYCFYRLLDSPTCRLMSAPIVLLAGTRAVASLATACTRLELTLMNLHFMLIALNPRTLVPRFPLMPLSLLLYSKPQQSSKLSPFLQ